MKREIFIKQLIKNSGYNLKNFAKEINMPYSTLLSILNHSIGGASIDNVFKICSKLGISTDALIELPNIQYENNNLTEYELNFIKKYRLLDRFAQKMINNLLEIEFERMESTKTKLKNSMVRSLFYYHIIPNARTDEQSFDDLLKLKLSVPITDKTKEADFVIIINNDNMEPLYYDGELILVKSQKNIDIGDVGVFIMDGKLSVYRFYGKKLISENLKYENISINSLKNFKIIGKVIGKLEREE